VDLGPDGEPRRAGHDVEALVVLGVAVLLRPVGAGRDGDLTDPETVPGGGAVLEDAHGHRPGERDLAVVRSDDRHQGHRDPSSLRESALSRTNVGAERSSCK
jgi:hypothetical protein